MGLEEQAGSGQLAGQLLIAMPALDTGVFAHAVIYLCAHGPEGALGLIVNQPAPPQRFDDVLQQLQVAPLPPARRIGVCLGGPVETGRGFVLHSADWTGEGSLIVDEHMALTGSLDVLKALAGGGGPARGLLALGYAGWGPGQLDREMQENAWLSAPAPLDLVFDADHPTKWRRALASLRVDPALLSPTAGHA